MAAATNRQTFIFISNHVKTALSEPDPKARFENDGVGICAACPKLCAYWMAHGGDERSLERAAQFAISPSNAAYYIYPGEIEVQMNALTNFLRLPFQAFSSSWVHFFRLYVSNASTGSLKRSSMAPGLRAIVDSVCQRGEALRSVSSSDLPIWSFWSKQRKNKNRSGAKTREILLEALCGHSRVSSVTCAGGSSAIEKKFSAQIGRMLAAWPLRHLRSLSISCSSFEYVADKDVLVGIDGIVSFLQHGASLCKAFEELALSSPSKQQRAAHSIRTSLHRFYGPLFGAISVGSRISLKLSTPGQRLTRGVCRLLQLAAPGGWGVRVLSLVGMNFNCNSKRPSPISMLCAAAKQLTPDAIALQRCIFGSSASAAVSALMQQASSSFHFSENKGLKSIGSILKTLDAESDLNRRVLVLRGSKHCVLDSRYAVRLCSAISQRSLTHLCLSSAGLSHTCMQAVSRALETCPALQMLDLSNNPDIGPTGVHAISHALRHLAFLEQLLLSNIDMQTQGLAYLANYIHLNPRLANLVLDENEIDISGQSEAMSKLCQNFVMRPRISFNANRCMGMRRVSLSSNTSSPLQTSDDDEADGEEHALSLHQFHSFALCVSVPASISLRELALRNCGLSPQHISYLTRALSSNASIQHLDLRDNAVGSGTIISELLSFNSKSLQRLYLCGNALGSVGCAALADGLSSNTHLCFLGLARNSICFHNSLKNSFTTIGLKALFSSMKKAYKAGSILSELDLSCNGLGASGGKLCRAFLLSNASRLRTVHTKGNDIGVHLRREISSLNENVKDPMHNGFEDVESIDWVGENAKARVGVPVNVDVLKAPFRKTAKERDSLDLESLVDIESLSTQSGPESVSESEESDVEENEVLRTARPDRMRAPAPLLSAPSQDAYAQTPATSRSRKELSLSKLDLTGAVVLGMSEEISNRMRPLKKQLLNDPMWEESLERFAAAYLSSRTNPTNASAFSSSRD